MTTTAPVAGDFGAPALTPGTPTPATYRTHTSTGETFPHWQPGGALTHASILAIKTGQPVAVERWDTTRQAWVLVDLAGSPQ